MSRRVELLVLCASCLLFLFFGAAWIHLPGPQQDELLHVPVLSPLMRAEVLYSLKFDGHSIPLMIMSYVGALKGWLLWLWFLVVPMGVPGYRAFCILVGLVTLGLVFWFVRRHWGVAVALLTTVLLATDPSFVHSIRLDYGPVAMAHLLKMGGLCLLARWVTSGSWRSLAGGFFLFGLGVWDKGNFVWFLAGLGATVVLLFPREALKRIRAQPGAVVIAAAALILGAAPLIAFNARYSGMTWQERGRLEIRWFKLYQAQGTLNGNFMSELTGEDQLAASPPAHGVAFPRFADWMYRIGGRRQTIILPLLCMAVALLPLSLWIGRRRALLFPLLVSLFTYAAMFVTFDGGSSVHHVIMVQPFPLLFLAASLWTPVERWPRPAVRALALVPVMAALAVSLSLNARHLAIYTRTGGTGGFTDAAYRLAAYLAQQPDKKVYALDWGFSNPVTFLANVRVDDFFYALNEPNNAEAVELLSQRMRDPESLFLLHSPQRTLFPSPAGRFFSLLDQGVEMRQSAFFQERSGEMVYELYESGRADPRPEAPAAVEVRFIPGRIGRARPYVIEVRDFPNTWIDVVYHVDRASSGAAMRFCKLDAGGRATLMVPVSHPLATVRVVFIRPSGGQWRPARGAITVTE